jgi:hypothetical protein
MASNKVFAKPGFYGIFSINLAFDQNLGSGHAKYLKNWKKSFKNSRFLVLNIPFWVQNCRSKDFFEI